MTFMIRDMMETVGHSEILWSRLFLPSGSCQLLLNGGVLAKYWLTA